MKSQEVGIKATLAVILKSDAEVLDEVMVVAYGTAKRSAFTGSATEMKAKELDTHVISNAASALAGKVAGVQSTSSSGAQGSTPTIRIRGIGSINASAAPLYVVDGAPYEASIANINPNDIESISVLKDASASAIYGARGANGVVIITTKRAKTGEAEIKLDAKWGSNSRLVPQYDVITDPGQYYETHYKAMYNSVYYNGGSKADAYAFADKNLFNENNGGLGYQIYSVPDGEKLIGTNFKLNPNAVMGYSDGQYYYTADNWYDETFHSSFRHEYNLSASGATDRLNYYASVGYLSDGGMVNNSDYERYTARTNVEYQAKKWLKLIASTSFTHTISQQPNYDTAWGSSGNLFYIVNTIAPIYPLYVRNTDGSIMTNTGGTIYDSNQTNFHRPGFVGNAVRDNEYDSRKSNVDLFSGKWSAVVSPIEGLNLTAAISASSYNRRYNILYSRFGSGTADDGGAYVSSDRTFSVNQQYLANYTKTIAELHNITALLGYEQYKYKEQGHTGFNDHLYAPGIGELDNALGTDKKDVGSYTDNYMTEGFLGRLQYDYDNKYFVSASFRRDASSVFAPGHRWGSFGSVGLAWQMNKENFLKDIEWIDLLKLKASYGEQGNDGILDGSGYRSYYAYADRYNTTYNKETGEYSITMSRKGNEDLTWETSKAWNVGVDFTFFGSRLNGTIDYYTRKTSDMLYFKTLPLSSGISVSSYPANIGTMRNSGIELTLDGTIIKTRNLEWGLNMNLTHNKNKILTLDPGIAETGLVYSGRIIKEGGTIYQAYMVKYAGTNKETGKAQFYMNQEVDGVIERVITEDITKATKYDCGTTLPDVYGGFGTSLSAYGFDFSAQLAFQLGGKIYDGVYQSLMHNGLSAGTNMHKDLLDAWSPENTGSDIPRLSSSSTDDPGVGSQTPMDRFLTSSNYLSLNNVTLGYTIPKSITRCLDLGAVRLYLAGENLFLLTKRKGLDPRFNYGIGSMTGGSGMSSSAYSAVRSFTGGISITF